VNRFDRIFGCLAGIAIGDGLGAPTEFLTPEQIRKEYGWVANLVRSPDWHPHHILEPGEVTDDTGQVLAVAHAYSEDGKLDAENVARQLILWADSNSAKLPVVLGPSTRQALDLLRKGESPRKTGKNGATNGAAYRALVVGLVNYDRQDQLIPQVVEACLPTHGTTVAISGAAAAGFAVAAAMKDGATPGGMIEAACLGAEAGSRQGEWRWSTPLDQRIRLASRIVSESKDYPEALAAIFNFVGVDMLVAESVAAAMGLVQLANGDPMLAVQYGANIGGDTDTIAAIAGGICGAYSGIASIDRILLARIEKINHLDLAAEAARLDNIIQNRGASHG